MHINRLFGIVYLLINNKSMTARDLAQYFEVSVRTILRDVDVLTRAGIPLYTTQGKGGGIHIMDNFVFNKAMVSEEDQNQILYALQSMSVAGPSGTNGVLHKLRSLFNKTETDWIEVNFSRWGNDNYDEKKFELLKDSVVNSKSVQFTYSSSEGETTKRQAHPIKLIFKTRSWYLMAYCLYREGYRLFKLSRMRNLEALNDCFDKSAYLAPSIESFDSDVPSLVVLKLLFPPFLAYRVYDEYDEKAIEEREDGSFIVSVVLPEDNWLYSYLLSFGPNIEILEPVRIRGELVKLARMVIEKYSQ